MTLDKELIRIKERIDNQINDLLLATKPRYDDSITGMNEAWEVVSRIFYEEIKDAISGRPPQ